MSSRSGDAAGSGSNSNAALASAFSSGAAVGLGDAVGSSSYVTLDSGKAVLCLGFCSDSGMASGLGSGAAIGSGLGLAVLWALT